jgi:hypothetical protein
LLVEIVKSPVCIAIFPHLWEEGEFIAASYFETGGHLGRRQAFAAVLHWTYERRWPNLCSEERREASGNI